jgi:hypothetical protein
VHSLSRTARLFALLGMGIADSVAVSWTAKFDYHFWRPGDAIRNASTDGNPATPREAKTLPDPGTSDRGSARNIPHLGPTDRVLDNPQVHRYSTACRKERLRFLYPETALPTIRTSAVRTRTVKAGLAMELLAERPRTPVIHGAGLSSVSERKPVERVSIRARKVCRSAAGGIG